MKTLIQKGLRMNKNMLYLMVANCFLSAFAFALVAMCRPASNLVVFLTAIVFVLCCVVLGAFKAYYK